MPGQNSFQTNKYRVQCDSVFELQKQVSKCYIEPVLLYGLENMDNQQVDTEITRDKRDVVS